MQSWTLVTKQMPNRGERMKSALPRSSLLETRLTRLRLKREFRIQKGGDPFFSDLGGSELFETSPKKKTDVFSKNQEKLVDRWEDGTKRGNHCSLLHAADMADAADILIPDSPIRRGKGLDKAWIRDAFEECFAWLGCLEITREQLQGTMS